MDSQRSKDTKYNVDMIKHLTNRPIYTKYPKG